MDYTADVCLCGSGPTHADRGQPPAPASIQPSLPPPPLTKEVTQKRRRAAYNGAVSKTRRKAAQRVSMAPLPASTAGGAGRSEAAPSAETAPSSGRRQADWRSTASHPNIELDCQSPRLGEGSRRWSALSGPQFLTDVQRFKPELHELDLWD